MRILAITRGAPPFKDVVSVGSAIRAFSMLKYFKKAGAECYFVSGGNELNGLDRQIEGIEIIPFYMDGEIQDILGALQPDTIIVNVYELLPYLPENSETIVILDLFAHRFLEAFYENVDLSTDLFLKIDSLRKADYFVVSNTRQRDFVFSLLLISGIVDSISRVLVVPHLLPDYFIERRIPSEPVFIAGGFNWPWQNDREYIETLLTILESKGSGELRLYGGSFPIKSRTDHVNLPIKNSPCLKIMGSIPYEKLLREYSEASCGLLCFEKNLERYFSFNFRAADYLSCGVPVIVSDFMQISELVRRYDAGWVIRDREEFKDVVEKIISDAVIISEKSDNAMVLAGQEFAPAKNMEGIFQFVKNARKPERREGLLSGLIRIVDRYVKEGVEHSNIIRELRRLEAESIRLAERIVAKDQEILRLNNEKTEVVRENGWVKDELKRVKEESERLKDEILRLKNERDRFEREAEDLKSRVFELSRKVGFLEDEKVRMSNDISIKEDEILRLKNEIVEHKRSILTYESEIQKRDILIVELRKKEAELEGIKSLPMYKLYKKVF